MDNEEIKILLQMFNVAVFILKINDLKPAIDASKPSSTIYGILTSSDICVKLNSGSLQIITMIFHQIYMYVILH